MKTKLTKEEQSNFVFKIGDHVKCIDDSYSSGLKYNYLYKIIGFNIIYGPCYQIFICELFDNKKITPASSFMQKRFELCQKVIIESL